MQRWARFFLITCLAGLSFSPGLATDQSDNPPPKSLTALNLKPVRSLGTNAFRLIVMGSLTRRALVAEFSPDRTGRTVGNILFYEPGDDRRLKQIGKIRFADEMRFATLMGHIDDAIWPALPVPESESRSICLDGDHWTVERIMNGVVRREDGGCDQKSPLLNLVRHVVTRHIVLFGDEARPMSMNPKN